MLSTVEDTVMLMINLAYSGVLLGVFLLFAQTTTLTRREERRDDLASEKIKRKIRFQN